MKGKYEITGPGVCETADSASLALSFAINLANHAAINRLDNTYYVTGPDGNVCGRTEADAATKAVAIYGERFYGATEPGFTAIIEAVAA